MNEQADSQRVQELAADLRMLILDVDGVLTDESFADADGITGRVLAMFGAGEFDVCTIVYNQFRSALTQVVTTQQLIPFATAAGEAAAGEEPT